MATTIKMPQLGESVTEGTIERWLVKEGDTVEQYDPLFEVVTDKVNAEVPAEVAGTISKILVSDGETVAVGTPVAEIDADGAGAADASSDAAAPAEPAQPEAGADAGSQAVEGQEVAPASAEEPAQPEQQEQPPAEQPQAEQPQAEQPQEAPAGQAQAEQAPAPAAGNGADGDGGTTRMTPAVRRLVREHDVDVSQIKGTGAGGRVTRDDVLGFIQGGAAQAQPAQPAQPAQAAQAAQAQPAQPAEAQPAAAQAEAPAPEAAAPTPPSAPAPATPAPAPVPAPTGGDTEVPLSQMRKAIAKKMTGVKQTVPHAYTVVEVDMTPVVKWREANNMAFKAREGASLSYVAVVVKAVTETLRKHPTMNSQFAEDKIILKQAMNIGIAVAVDNGLIVPVIANADQLSISGVNARIRDISSRAHSGKLKLDELQGGTFTVNNTGWFGSVSSMPIVNAPEVAILSMEAIVKRPRVMDIDGEDVIAIRHMMNMTCSFDHRVLDGAQVGFFLADVRKFLEEWDANTPVG
jgi:2-oxoisovalerate dehydrogenase E2 component (dihydrolipoyl transacylase)